MSDSACGRFVVVRIVVVVPQDDWGWGDVAFTGSNGPSHTPTLDRLAARGMTFTDFHTASPVCSPSRVGFMVRTQWLLDRQIVLWLVAFTFSHCMHD